MKTLPITQFGETVQGVRLFGDPKLRSEPESFRVVFPGGDVDVVRCDDGDYWVHVRVDSRRDVGEERATHVGQVVDTRVDYVERGNGVSADLGAPVGLGTPYHLAVRIASEKL